MKWRDQGQLARDLQGSGGECVKVKRNSHNPFPKEGEKRKGGTENKREEKRKGGHWSFKLKDWATVTTAKNKPAIKTAHTHKHCTLNVDRTPAE